MTISSWQLYSAIKSSLEHRDKEVLTNADFYEIIPPLGSSDPKFLKVLIECALRDGILRKTGFGGEYKLEPIERLIDWSTGYLNGQKGAN